MKGTLGGVTGEEGVNFVAYLQVSRQNVNRTKSEKTEHVQSQGRDSTTIHTNFKTAHLLCVNDLLK